MPAVRSLEVWSPYPSLRRPLHPGPQIWSSSSSPYSSLSILQKNLMKSCVEGLTAFEITTSIPPSCSMVVFTALIQSFWLPASYIHENISQKIAIGSEIPNGLSVFDGGSYTLNNNCLHIILCRKLRRHFIGCLLARCIIDGDIASFRGEFPGDHGTEASVFEIFISRSSRYLTCWFSS